MAVHSNRYLGFPEAESVKCESFSVVLLFATPGTVAHQAPLSMGFSRQEYWSGLHFPPPGDLPNPGIKPTSLTSPALAGGFFTTNATWEGQYTIDITLVSGIFVEYSILCSSKGCEDQLNVI